MTNLWKRAIILVDMNAFFASIEQLDNPAWRGRPIGVTNGTQGTCIITCSYEARAYGIKTGMRLPEAKRLCPGFIQCPARPKRYAHVSKAIMAALHDITPDIEVFSVDEAFLDVTACQRLWGTPAEIGEMVKRKVYETVGIHCSIGISGDKTTSKYAAKLQKPNGLTLIHPNDAKARLSKVPVTELCGIADGIGRFLAQYGVHYCGDMQKLPISILAKRFGNIGRRIWLMCQGADPDPIHMHVPAAKSMGHGKVMPPKTKDKRVILTYLSHMAEKLAARLRRHNMQAQTFFIGLRSREFGWISTKARLAYPTNDGHVILKQCQIILNQQWCGEPVDQVQVTALDPNGITRQLDFFEDYDDDYNSSRGQLNSAIDVINQHYGELTICSARLLNRSGMPNVIAPAWKPEAPSQVALQNKDHWPLL